MLCIPRSEINNYFIVIDINLEAAAGSARGAVELIVHIPLPSLTHYPSQPRKR